MSDESQAKQAAEDAMAKQAAKKAEADAKAAAKAKAETTDAPKPTAKAAKKAAKKADPKAPEPAQKPAAASDAHEPRAKPELDEATEDALRKRAEEDARRPGFIRHEWFRYKKLGGKNAPWRRPTGIHSKQRRHYKYRPPVVSIGYRGPAAARGLHPSGFEEVLVHRPEDLDGLDAKKQAARVGGTVGGRKAELIEKKADDMGIRVLNRRT